MARVVRRTAALRPAMAGTSELGVCALCRLAGLMLALLSPVPAGAAECYGYDQGGSRFAPLDHITPGNVDQPVPAWTYHTGDLKSRAPDVLKRSKFEVTPIPVGDKLVACTPFNAVVALDPGTGRELWRYGPEIKTNYRIQHVQLPWRGVLARPRRRGRAVRRADCDRDRPYFTPR
jgi:glucose dehydrogenase